MTTRPRKLFLLCTAMSFLAGGGAAMGQEAEFAEEMFSDELLLFQEIPSVFGASKYEQKVTEAPSSVSIVTAEEIEKYGYRTMADILRRVRSFYVTNDHNYEYVGVRGFGRPGDYNGRILVLIDGHRVNENIYDSWAPGRDFIIDVDLIDRLEVIRGPSSSLYGTGAFFGVINIITKRGRDLQGTEMSVSGASHDSYDTNVIYGDRYDNGLEMIVSGTAYDSEGRDWYYPAFDDPATNNGVADGQDMERNYNGFFKASFADWTMSGALVRRDKDIPTAPWWVEFNRTTQTRDFLSYADLLYEHVYASKLSLSGRISYNYYKYQGYYPYFWEGSDIRDWYGLDLPSGVYPGYDEAVGEWWQYELQASQQLGSRHKLIGGVEYRDNSKQQQEYYDLAGYHSTRSLASSANVDIWAVYLQDEIRLLDNLILNAGLRHDDYELFGDSTNPRVGLIYNPASGTSLKFLYGRAFRAPNAYEIFYNDGGLSTKDNPDLGPEEITTYEAVWEQRITDRLRSVVSLFFYEIEDLISQVVDPADGLLMFENVDKVRAHGFECEFEGRWHEVEGRISYTYQETEDDASGAILSNSPRNLFKLNMNTPLWEEMVYGALELQYMSKRQTTAGKTLEGFAVTNVTMYSNHFYSDKVEFSAGVFNLFDKGYKDPGAEEHFFQPNGIEQDGRTYHFKLTFTF